MLHESDDWNDDLVEFFSQFPFIKFFRENKGYGRYGIHEYFNELYTHATGDWIIYFCDDHFIIRHDWVEDLRRIIYTKKLDSSLPHILISRFDNVGPMNHVLSRGYMEALEGQIGQSAWIDTYINDLLQVLPDTYYTLVQEKMFHDFTHDNPQPMTEQHSYIELDEDYIRHRVEPGTLRMRKLVEHDAERIKKFNKKGKR